MRAGLRGTRGSVRVAGTPVRRCGRDLQKHHAPSGLPLAVALALLAGACSQTLDAGGNLPDPLLDKLVGYWRLDDGKGSTTAFDSSGNGNQGAVRNLDPSTSWVAGRSRTALAIAHAGWVQVAPSPSIDSIVDQITVSAWIYQEAAITAADLWGTALSRQMGSGIDEHYHISLIQDGRPSLFITTGDGYELLQAANSAPMTTWTHLAGSYDGAMVRLYVNGALAASAALTGTFVPDTTPVILGGNANDASGVPTELFPGRIDELMLYARALGPAEIGRLAAGALFPGTLRDAGAD
jgi:hypothetical protein